MSKLILTSEVSGLGSAVDVVEVKNGYARNYLVPQGLAIRGRRCREAGRLAEARALRARRRRSKTPSLLKAKLESSPVKLTVKAAARVACSAR